MRPDWEVNPQLRRVLTGRGLPALEHTAQTLGTAELTGQRKAQRGGREIVAKPAFILDGRQKPGAFPVNRGARYCELRPPEGLCSEGLWSEKAASQDAQKNVLGSSKLDLQKQGRGRRPRSRLEQGVSFHGSNAGLPACRLAQGGRDRLL